MKHYWMVLVFFLCVTSSSPAQNAELKTLRQEDQASRGVPAEGIGKITRSDNDRIKRVLELLAQGAAQTPEDKFNAALVLQHTPATFCGKRLIGQSPDNYLLAHFLARQSFEAGYADAGMLVAQTIDRYLAFTEGRQKYGTNFFPNQKTGKEELAPIDRSVPDSERTRYGVAPLAELLKQFPEQSAPKKPDAKKKSGKTGK